MSEPFLGEIRMFGFGFTPAGWAACDGQIMAINQNQALFSLLGTTYGGNGTTTFALPDLRGRVPVHFGNQVPLGAMAGEEAHILQVQEMPAHQHQPVGSSGAPNQPSPAGNKWATLATVNAYATQAPNGTLNAGAIGSAGSSQAHPNMQPYQAVNFCIALQGIYPSRN